MLRRISYLRVLGGRSIFMYIKVINYNHTTYLVEFLNYFSFLPM